VVDVNGKPLASIVSAGLSKFGKLEGKYSREIFLEAARESFAECPNLDPRRDIKALFVGQMSESFEHQGHTGPSVCDWVGLLPVPATHVEAACASSGVALRCAVLSIVSGMYDVVLVGGVEKMTHRSTSDATEYLAMAADFPFEQWNGVTFPSLFGLMARAHMSRYGTTEEQLAMVAVKNHQHGCMNPKAQIQREITVRQVLESRPVASPLKLFDCSLISDGASCLILTKPKLARRYSDSPVDIIGSGQGSGTIGLYEREDVTYMESARSAAREAYRMAGKRAGDIDVAEVHDCFTIAEVMAYEDLDFCKPGEGGRFVEKGETRLGGSLPVNTSGGLKAKGHPVGATGTAQACEIYLQLTGRGGQRQVKGAKLGLTHNVGGSGSTAVVHIYKRRE